MLVAFRFLYNSKIPECHQIWSFR